MRNPCFQQATFADTPQAEKAGLVARVVPLGAEVEEVWMKSIHCLRFVKT